MSVSEYDDLRIGKRGVERRRRGAAELVAVGDDDIEPLKPQLGDPGKARPEIRSIGVAVHGGDGSQRLELGQNVGMAHVAGMEDMVDARECIEHLGPKQPMRI